MTDSLRALAVLEPSASGWTHLDVMRERTVRDVRDTAAEILAAVGAVRLRRIALFRATKWAEISAEAYLYDREHADVQWVRAAEWLRIGWSFPRPQHHELH